MPTYLTFALVAPLGAMGELAVGERRGSWDRPGRSAVLGLRMDTLVTAFALDRGALMLDTLVLRSDLADATGGGRVNIIGEP